MLAAAVLFPSAASAGDSLEPGSTSPAPAPTPLVASVLSPPHVFPGSDGRNHLVYEIQLSNVTSGKVELKQITVVDVGSQKPLQVLGSAAIAARLSLGGHRGSESATVGAYQFAVAFMHVTLAADAPVPTALTHQIEGFFEQMKAELSMRIAETPVITGALPVLGAPFRGEGYVVGDGCCDSVRHVRALLPLNGAFRLAQRFAIDWERIDAENRIFVGDAKDAESYRIYGEPVFAVADGTVVDASDGLPDQVPGELPSGLPIAEADGNFVVLDVGGGVYVLFAHLKPGSLTVKTGDRVRRGDQIGNVGNTGNSQAPHLHLHVMDGPFPLLANGLPYVFDGFAITASDEIGTADFDRAEATGSPMTLTPRIPPAELRHVLPLDLSIVTWGDGMPPPGP